MLPLLAAMQTEQQLRGIIDSLVEDFRVEAVYVL